MPTWAAAQDVLGRSFIDLIDSADHVDFSSVALRAIILSDACVTFVSQNHSVLCVTFVSQTKGRPLSWVTNAKTMAGCNCCRLRLGS